MPGTSVSIMQGPELVPMVALATGSSAPLGARLVYCLSIQGARMVLLGRPDQKSVMEQVGRRGACLGAPSADVHEVDVGAAMRRGLAAARGGPPVESLEAAVQGVLSRQGNVDMLLLCPPGGDVATWQRPAQQQEHHFLATSLTTLLAPVLLWPADGNKAVITVIPRSNQQLMEWAAALPRHLEQAAAEDKTQTSSPTAAGGSREERRAAAGKMLLLNVVVEDLAAGGGAAGASADMSSLAERVAEVVLDALKEWQQVAEAASHPLGAQQQHPKVLHVELTPPAATTTASSSSRGARAPAGAEEGEGGGALAGSIKAIKHMLLAGKDTGSSTSSSQQHPAPAVVPGVLPSSSAAAAAVHLKIKQHALAGSDTTHGLSRLFGGTTTTRERRAQHKLTALTHQDERALIQELELLLGGKALPAGAVGLTAGGQGAPPAWLPGQDPSPRPGATCKAPHPGQALWVKPASPAIGGILLASGARSGPGLLTRLRQGPGELAKAAAALPGAVLTPADPNNLEPETDKAYGGEPTRHPAYLVQCFKPFNGETPHRLLAEEFLTPSELFYVRNHLPVPSKLKAEGYTIQLEGLPGKAGGGGKGGGSSLLPGKKKGQKGGDEAGGGGVVLALEELATGRWGPVVAQQVVLQCAGNRRVEMCAVKLVEGRAPWNHGSIGNAEFTGVLLREVLLRAGLDPGEEQQQGPGAVRHLVAEGWDYHHDSKQHFQVSIPLPKVLDPAGGVMLAWEMNGAPLLPDHGYPVRLLVPGFVGTRSVKWLRRLVLSPTESSAAWQQKDYKLMPQRFTTLGAADFSSMPPIMAMPVQSAILLPEPGSVIPGGAARGGVWFRGYAWGGGGLPITRVDVSAYGGATWERADVCEGQAGDGSTGPAWTWSKWQLALQVPEQLRQGGGHWRVACKAFNANGDTQPASMGSIWNFRGLAGNAWHAVDLAVVGEQEGEGGQPARA